MSGCQNVGLVPTMGALHEGHRSLIEASVGKCDTTVVSVFVNPTQFGPNEDFDKYPRTLEADVEICRVAGADVVFAPSAEEMYNVPHPLTPSPVGAGGNLTMVMPPLDYVDKLCGKSRPGHFDGVCTVVNKLFNVVRPDYAFFGEKDRQQLIIIQKMVKDLNIPVEIVPCPIVRDADGLALSSRNKYLTPEQKTDALALNKILHNIKMCYNKGITDIKSLSETAYAFLNENHSLEYIEFLDKNDLERKEAADSDTVVFIAAKVGGVRLIDNMELDCHAPA